MSQHPGNRAQIHPNGRSNSGRQQPMFLQPISYQTQNGQVSGYQYTPQSGQVNGFQYQQQGGFKQKPRFPNIEKDLYETLRSYCDLKSDHEQSLKYPVFATYWTSVLRQLKRNSIINRRYLEEIYPGDDKSKEYHLKKVYCSPNRVQNDALYADFKEILGQILSE
jgi:hypothetical protein